MKRYVSKFENQLTESNLDDKLKRLKASMERYRQEMRDNPYDRTAKDLYNKTWKQVYKLEKSIEKEKLGAKGLIKIFQSFGLKAVKYQSTSIRGYSIPSSNSYEFNSNDPRAVSFFGIDDNKFNKLVDAVEQNGFILEQKQSPSKSIGAGMVSSFFIKNI